MTRYDEKKMPRVTFAGAGTGTVPLGEFTIKSRGLGDTELNTATQIFKEDRNSLLFNLDVSLRTGSITRTGQILLPTGAQPIVRLDYSMQLGSGTFDLLPSLTYMGGVGDIHRMSGWASYRLIPEVSALIRLAGEIDTGISGIDPNFVGAAQTADPDNYGSRTAEIGSGLNFTGSEGGL
jgi:hypothetical protein